MIDRRRCEGESSWADEIRLLLVPTLLMPMLLLTNSPWCREQ
jgi:hypothetical protein